MNIDVYIFLGALILVATIKLFISASTDMISYGTLPWSGSRANESMPFILSTETGRARPETRNIVDALYPDFSGSSKLSSLIVNMLCGRKI